MQNVYRFTSHYNRSTYDRDMVLLDTMGTRLPKEYQLVFCSLTPEGAREWGFIYNEATLYEIPSTKIAMIWVKAWRRPEDAYLVPLDEVIDILDDVEARCAWTDANDGYVLHVEDCVAAVLPRGWRTIG